MLAYENFDGPRVWDSKETLSQNAQKVCLLTRPTLAVTSPARPESAKTVSLPRDTPCPRQSRSSVADPRFTPHGYWERCENEAGRFFSIQLELVERLTPEDSKRFSCV